MNTIPQFSHVRFPPPSLIPVNRIGVVIGILTPAGEGKQYRGHVSPETSAAIEKLLDGEIRP